jgi:hypothetical protein
MAARTPLEVGQQVPHFSLESLDGSRIAYADIWQRRHLLLVLIPETEAAGPYLDLLSPRMDELTAHDTACVISRGSVEGLYGPGLLIADRWGEIQFLATAGGVEELPPPEELLETLRYVQMQCPECQGEAR